MQDDFTVRVGLKPCVGLELFAQYSVVVDFSIDGQEQGFLLVYEGLRSAICCNTVRKIEGLFSSETSRKSTNADNTQAFVSQN